MDKRILIGVAAVIIIGIGFYAMTINPPIEPPDIPNGGDTSEPDGSTEPDGGTDEPETATISGTVTDAMGDPVSGATVEVDGVTVTTGSDGKYLFTVDIGTYDIDVSKSGYEPTSDSVSASADWAYDVDFSMVIIAPDEPDMVTLKIITRHGFDILYKAREAFIKTDIAASVGITNKEQIRFMGVSSSLWTDTITRSGDIDLAWGGGPVIFDIIYNAGLLAPLDDPALLALLSELPDEISGVPAKRISNGEVYWTGSAIASFGFTINTDFLEREGLPIPTKWSDLANETYAVTLPGIVSIGTADATLSTSNTRMFEIILQTYGWEDGWKLLTIMGANARIFDKSESVRDAVISGIIGAGTTIDFYGYTAQLQNPEFCIYVLPEDGTIVNADPIAMVSTTDNPEAAQAFIRWLLSTEGQKIWLDESINRLPMNPAVFDTPEGLERSDLKEIYERTLEALIVEFSDEEALSYETAMMFFYSGSIVKAQGKLQSTWTELTYAQEIGEITHKQFLELTDDLSNPLELEFIDPTTGMTETFTIEYAKSINSRLKDAAYKSELVDAWRVAAEDRYDEVYAELLLIS